MPASRSCDALLHQRHAQPVGAAGQRRARRGERTVAVAVGLHHGPHLHRRRPT